MTTTTTTTIGDGLHIITHDDGSARLVRTSGPAPDKGGGVIAKIKLDAEALASLASAIKPPTPRSKPAAD